MTAAVDVGADGASAAAAGAASSADKALPPLRDDLVLGEGPAAVDGSPTWTIYDPARGRYFRIGRTAFLLLSHWRLGAPVAVVAAANRISTITITGRDVERLVHFLRANNLIDGSAPGQMGSYLAQARAARQGWAKRILHGYLYTRIPLIRPDRFLNAAWPLVRPLFTTTFLMLLAAAGLIGVFLALRQWDRFLATFPYFFSLEGASVLVATLVVVKVLHEFGHAFMAKRYGCRVPAMGVALLVMFPVLFTDTTDAWRLTSRRQRLLVGAGGILVELCLAMIATLLWSFLPDGPLRSAVFVVATVTWIGTLAVNLNPMMRFDGYYMLSDFLGVQNLQARGFALARWRLREALFGFGEPPPERLPPRLYRATLVYAFSTWVWRFFLFVGIALLVYHVFFKLLGIALMTVELAWFIGLPVKKELGEWWRRRGSVRLNRNLIVALILLGGGIWLLATPWQTRITVPAVMAARDYATLYPPVAARVAAVHVEEGQAVKSGDVLFELASPDLKRRLVQARQKLEVTQLMIRRRAASGETAESVGVLETELAANLAAYRGLVAEKDKLTVRAPLAGEVVDIPPGLAPGRWVGVKQMLGRVVDRSAARLDAYAQGADLDRLRVGARGRFLAEDPARESLDVAVIEIESMGVARLDRPYLASTYGGSVAVRRDRDRKAVPEEAIYRVVLEPADGAPAPAQVTRGTVSIEADAASPLRRLWRAVVAVLIRESGF